MYEHMFAISCQLYHVRVRGTPRMYILNVNQRDLLADVVSVCLDSFSSFFFLGSRCQRLLIYADTGGGQLQGGNESKRNVLEVFCFGLNNWTITESC